MELRIPCFVSLVVIALSCSSVGALPQCHLPPTAGRGLRWPVPNPGLVAPVALKYDYPSYDQPLLAERTRTSISVKIPSEYAAGFNLTDAQGEAKEAYILRFIEIRRPGRGTEGMGQGFSHVLEATLLHENTFGRPGTWASVVVPFSVEAGASIDMLSALVDGSTLPIKFGQRTPALKRGVQKLDLNQAFDSANFLSSWTSLPTGCADVTRPARLFLRNESLLTSQFAFKSILRALQKAPQAPPLPATGTNWLTGTCIGQGASCVMLQPADIGGQLLEAQTLQSQAVSGIRTAKAVMDSALLNLNNVSEADYKDAIDARENLQAASAELDTATRHVDRLEAWVEEARSTIWDANAPPIIAPSTALAPPTPAAAAISTPAPPPVVESTTNSVTVASTVASTTAAVTTSQAAEATTSPSTSVFTSSTGQTAATADLSTTVPPTTSPQSGNESSSPSSLLSMGSRRVRADSHSASAGDCFALGRSPIDISSSAVSTEQASWSDARRSPLVFAQASSELSAGVHLFNTGEHLRLVAPADAGSPIGSLSDGDGRHNIVFVDLHVPGEHLINGQAAAAEVQLVHLPATPGPAFAVALRLETGGNSTVWENPWLALLIQALPPPRSKVLMQLQHGALGGLHAALARGYAERYFRYDGTLTRAPCRSAKWFVLEEPGRISEAQLAALIAAMPNTPSRALRQKPLSFVATGPVAEGVLELPFSAALAGSSEENVHDFPAASAPTKTVEHISSLTDSPVDEIGGEKFGSLLGKYRRTQRSQQLLSTM